MQTKIILETPRLVLREFVLTDAQFILELLNTPTWLKFIGDKGVNSSEDAKQYLIDGPIASYEKYGFGSWLVQLKESGEPIGMCGLLKRTFLEHVDIGFALLPVYEGFGYGCEMASATMQYGRQTHGIDHIIAITDPHNRPSIHLLEKLGLQFEKTLDLSGNDEVLMFSPPNNDSDKEEIEVLATTFFGLFTNTGDSKPNVEKMWDLFIPDARIINNTTEPTEVYDLDAFIQPRVQILTDGTLVDFREQEISSTTKVYHGIAHRWSLYEKSGTRNGQYFRSTGIKTIQFIKSNGTWKIASLAWNDEE